MFQADVDPKLLGHDCTGDREVAKRRIDRPEWSWTEQRHIQECFVNRTANIYTPTQRKIQVLVFSFNKRHLAFSTVPTKKVYSKP